MYCSSCGKEINDEAVVCVHCGCDLKKKKVFITVDSDNVGWIALGFFIPLAGLIVYLNYKDTDKIQAESAGKGAIVGFCSNIISFVYGSLIGTLFGFLF